MRPFKQFTKPLQSPGVLNIFIPDFEISHMATPLAIVQFRGAVFVLKTTPGEATWLPFNENSPIEIFCDLSCDEVYFLLIS